MNPRTIALLILLLASASHARHSHTLECGGINSGIHHTPSIDRHGSVLCRTESATCDAVYTPGQPFNPGHCDLSLQFSCNAILSRDMKLTQRHGWFLQMHDPSGTLTVTGRDTRLGIFFPDTRRFLTRLVDGDRISVNGTSWWAGDTTGLHQLLYNCQNAPPEALSDKSLSLIGDPDGTSFDGYRIPPFSSRIQNVSGCHAQLEFPPVCPDSRYNKPWVDLRCNERGTSLVYRQAMKGMLHELNLYFAYACPKDHGNHPAAAIRSHNFTVHGNGQP